MSEEQLDQRIDTPPDIKRQNELEAAYQQNIAAGKPPYTGVKIATYGELLWIFEQRQWSGERDRNNWPDYLPKGRKRPNLSRASLLGINLSGAQLYQADLSGASLSGINLSGANLLGANLSGADLRGADLTKAKLMNARLDSETLLGDITWDGVNPSQLNWGPVPRLGDDRSVYVASVNKARANRQIATLLRSQGINVHGDRFAYRANVFERQANLSRNPFTWLPWLGSLLLDGVAGYGYKPGRILFWYLVTIAGFMFMYMKASEGWIPFGLPAPTSLPQLPWYEALILSVSSFHGRGFFQPVQSLVDPIAALASIEAVIGLFIEVSFIATFTQRFFGK